MSEQDTRLVFKYAREFLDLVYPKTVFGETFTREQVAWIISAFVNRKDEGAE